MLRWTKGKDWTWAQRSCEVSYIGDDHLVNIVEHVESREKIIRNTLILDTINWEIQKRKDEWTRGLVKDTREWVPSEVRCLKCKDIISSEWEWQYKTCSCWEVSIDSTVYYTRIIWDRGSWEGIETHVMEWEFSNIKEYYEFVDKVREEGKKTTPLKVEAD